VTLRVQPLVGAQVLGRELRTHAVLLADEDQLPRGADVAVAEQIVNAMAEVLQAELGEMLGGRFFGDDRPMRSSPASLR